MTIAEQINEFFRVTSQSVFIEAEAKESRMMSFINEYNARYGTELSIYDEGIISLEETANKWGFELRCYFCDNDGFPAGVQVYSNHAYRAEYAYRFNDVEIIKALFDLGYRIGIN